MKARRQTIEEMQSLAASRGGKCISLFYHGAKEKLQWECIYGHTWWAIPNSVNRGSWCPICATAAKRTKLRGRTPVNKQTLEEIQQQVAARGFVCLSEVYQNCLEMLQWKCSRGHIWPQTWNAIKQGNGCPHCAGVAKKTIEDMHDLAARHRGKCLSKHYKNNQTRLLWQCSRGHRWYASPNAVQQGKWCPHCASSQAEEKCRFYMQSLLGKEFIRTRSVLGNRSELDGYCKDLELAFEYQGEQHYHFTRPYHRTHADVVKRREMDYVKKQRCKELGIDLIVIPYPVSRSNSLLRMFLRKHLEKRGLLQPPTELAA